VTVRNRAVYSSRLCRLALLVLVLCVIHCSSNVDCGISLLGYVADQGLRGVFREGTYFDRS